MNFLEALAKNEKVRVRVKWNGYGWHDVGSMKNNEKWNIDAITTQWEAEPEKIERTVELDKTSDGVIKMTFAHDYWDVENFLKRGLNKVKLTIEVLND